MPRRSRCVEPGLAYHVTQRGVDGVDVFRSQSDRRVYQDLAAEELDPARVSVLAYCWMTNHVHWIVVPEMADSLAVLFRRVHGRYAQYFNARRRRRGHLWQNRFFSCAVEGSHLWTALRYVERNPARAGMVRSPEEYQWSTAARHVVGPEMPGKIALDWTVWEQSGGAAGWRELIAAGETIDQVDRLRRCTYSGGPFGDEAFVSRMEERFDRHWREAGRPRKQPKSETGTEQTALVSVS